jgi:hypothetical protein
MAATNSHIYAFPVCEWFVWQAYQKSFFTDAPLTVNATAITARILRASAGISGAPNVKKIFVCFLLMTLFYAGTALTAAKGVPPELIALAAKAKVSEPIAAWCKGAIFAGKPLAYAVGIKESNNRGRYLAIDANAQVTTLATFSGEASVDCHTPAEARDLGKSISEHEAIHGGIKPQYRTAVICAFVEDAEAICWQYSPKANAFVKVGRWMT